ncbi:MAG TPA: NUDIX hydrolase [Acidimicrobiia bacterium]|nr:NUDIX hydrolase [Acidimicrobiia bacterium]
MTRVIKAAGGLVFRETAKGKLKVLIAHRPRYDDWGLPKGKADKGETPEETAIREVLEETGYHCRIVAPIGTTRYRIEGGIKEVNWYAMRPLPDSPGFKKNKEVDEIRWITRNKAKTALDYENDRDLVTSPGLKRLARTGTLFLLRHAAAGDRSKWSGVDAVRPINKKGKRQAAALADYLSGRGIERIYSSPFTRCVQTVEPLAEAIGAKVVEHDALAEGPDIDAAYGLADELVGYNAVLCSHGDVIPAVINRMMWAGLTLDSRFYCSKGSIWEIELDGGRFGTGTYVPPPKV